jgi:lipoprotein-anchoring transpeptidase ErfK/SrfK
MTLKMRFIGSVLAVMAVCFVTALAAVSPASARALAWPVPVDEPPEHAAPDAAPDAGAGTQKKIIVDLSAQRVTAYQGGAAVFAAPVSTGRNGNTAVGQFRIRNKRLAPLHARWGYNMPYWMGIYWVGKEWENGFHALPVTEGGALLWADQIGTPASDGCIVLRTADMRRLYQWAAVDTPVEIVE